MANTRVWCPRCNQGWVVPVHIPVAHRDALLCEECDALWFSREEVRQTGAFVDFGTYMQSFGAAGLWSEIELQDID